MVWNRRTGQPIHNAIVWQDRRAEPTCADLRQRGLADTFLRKTGLIVDAYFSGTKLKWILDHVPGAPNVVVAAGMSGHGFKFASLIGEVLADLALTGTTPHPVGFLSPLRFSA